jgi:hypothetical protein
VLLLLHLQAMSAGKVMMHGSMAAVWSCRCE